MYNSYLWLCLERDVCLHASHPTRYTSNFQAKAIHSFNLVLSRTHQALLNHHFLYPHHRGSCVDPGFLSLDDQVTPSTRYTSNGER